MDRTHLHPVCKLDENSAHISVFAHRFNCKVKCVWIKTLKTAKAALTTKQSNQLTTALGSKVATQASTLHIPSRILFKDAIDASFSLSMCLLGMAFVVKQ